MLVISEVSISLCNCKAVCSYADDLSWSLPMTSVILDEGRFGVAVPFVCFVLVWFGWWGGGGVSFVCKMGTKDMV